MAFTQAQITAMEKAIATGARKVRAANGSEVTYGSLAEMLSVLAMMKEDVAGTGRTTHVNPTFDRGL